MLRARGFAALLALLLALAASACQVEEFEGDPLVEDPLHEGYEEPGDTGGMGADM